MVITATQVSSQPVDTPVVGITTPVSSHPVDTLSSSSSSQTEVFSQLIDTLSSSPSSRSAVPSQPLFTTASLSPSQHTQISSTSQGETSKLVIGLIVAIVVPVLLVTIGLAYFCIKRKRRRRKDEVVTAQNDVNGTDGEGENPQLYFKQKVELDDEQRRHEMETTEIRYEMEGEDERLEMPGEERERRFGRQELRGEEHVKELDNAL